MKIARKGLFVLMLSIMCSAALAQKRVVQNRPYIDQRKFHYGFYLGMHLQDMEIQNAGRIDPETGEQWYADVDKYDPGFTVGVLGDMRLSNHFSLRLTPGIHFGQKRVMMREQLSGKTQSQNIRSAYVSIPIDVKFAAPRYNNFRPYLIGGMSPTIDVTTKKHDAIRLKPFDLYLELGMGCDIYLPFFKLNPELKFCIGLLDILQKNRSDLIDNNLGKFTKALDGGHSKMIVLTFNFE